MAPQWVDLLGLALGSTGLITGIVGFLTGRARERETTERYRLYTVAQIERDKALSQASPEGRKAIEAEPPISQPPPLGPALVAALVAGGIGVSAGSASTVALTPRQPAAISAPSSPQCKSCDPPCPRGQYCSGGTCVSNAESPEGAAAMLDGQKGGFMTLPGWQDTDRRTPWDYNPALDRQ
jgi:hypothetical protein